MQRLVFLSFKSYASDPMVGDTTLVDFVEGRLKRLLMDSYPATFNQEVWRVRNTQTGASQLGATDVTAGLQAAIADCDVLLAFVSKRYLAPDGDAWPAREYLTMKRLETDLGNGVRTSVSRVAVLWPFERSDNDPPYPTCLTNRTHQHVHDEPGKKGEDGQLLQRLDGFLKEVVKQAEAVRTMRVWLATHGQGKSAGNGPTALASADDVRTFLQQESPRLLQGFDFATRSSATLPTRPAQP